MHEFNWYTFKSNCAAKYIKFDAYSIAAFVDMSEVSGRKVYVFFCCLSLLVVFVSNVFIAVNPLNGNE